MEEKNEGDLHVWGKNKYQLTLTHNQLRVLERALDVYTRIGIGQLGIVAEEMDNLFPKHMKEISHWDLKDDFTGPMKRKVFGFSTGSSFGISNKEVSDKARISYDMQKRIQKRIAKAEQHSKMSVWHNDDSRLSLEPNIEIEEES